MKQSILLIITFSIIIACKNEPKKELSSYKSDISGFWDRKGTVKYINGVAVDTILIKDSDNTGYKQIKAYVDGNTMWMNNSVDTINNPWNAGMGGYGKFKIHSYDSLTEFMANGTGWFGAYLKKL